MDSGPAPRGASRNDERLGSRGAFSPELLQILILTLETEGAGNAGCALHPRSRVPKCVKMAHTSIQGSGNTPTSPAQWLYGLYRALPGERACCHRHRRDTPADLAPASRRQDHTTSPYALAFRPARKTCLTPKRPSHPAPYVS